MADEAMNLLERLGQLLIAEEAGLARSHGLRPVHARILRYLGRCNRFSNGTVAVAEYLGLTRGTVSVSLRHLVERGLVTQEGAASDQRRVSCRLTAAGAAVCAELEAGPKELSSALAALGDERRAALAENLRTLLAAWQSANRGRAFGLCRHCRHFLVAEAGGYRCGLTDEPLSPEEGDLLCRHWSAPPDAKEENTPAPVAKE